MTVWLRKRKVCLEVSNYGGFAGSTAIFALLYFFFPGSLDDLLSLALLDIYDNRRRADLGHPF
jgi:hypothetical protein